MAKETALTIPVEQVENRILLIRGHKVILDSDLADLYDVETKMLVSVHGKTAFLSLRA